MTDKIDFYRDEEWTAVYLNGSLVRVGDSYLADEWLQQRCGVVEHYDEDYFLGRDKTRENVAATTAEIDAFYHVEEEKQAEIARLRARLAELEN